MLPAMTTTATLNSNARLPQTEGELFVTDGGLETDLIFHHDVDLPYFAAFPLLDDARGRALLAQYYDGYAAIAACAGAGLLLETPTWRASMDWAERLGYSRTDLARVNRMSIAILGFLRDQYADSIPSILISGMVGPRGDGYRSGNAIDPDEAAAYHRLQAEAFAEAGADMLTAYTLTDADEAIGITRAAREVGLPVAISFTVETDGRLPSGPTLASAVQSVDSVAPPDYYLVNCAHPHHIEAGLLAEPGPWRERIVGLRVNASVRSHAELDNAIELDEGDPRLLALEHGRLMPLLPKLSIIGGCCGTDARHVAALWGNP
jgi:homocysteine S-methyltransferase